MRQMRTCIEHSMPGTNVRGPGNGKDDDEDDDRDDPGSGELAQIDNDDLYGRGVEPDDEFEEEENGG
jgi:hypothetical protein